MKKKTEIDFLNTLFCLLVIFIHVMSAPVTAVDTENPLYPAVFLSWRLAAFVVQGFIFLSGMKLFLNYTPGRYVNYGKYYVSRLKKIVMPYVLCVILYYIYFCRNGYFSPDIFDLGAYIIRGDMVSHFYFVVIIVQLYFLRPLWEWALEKSKPGFLVLSAAAVTLAMPRICGGFAYRDRLFVTYLVYWTGGCAAGAYYDKFKKWAEHHFGIVAAIFAVAAACEAAVSYAGMVKKINMPYIEEMHIVYCVCAVMFAYSAALKTGGKIMRSRLMKEINGASYYIYLMHCLFIYIVNDLMARAGGFSVMQEFIIRAVFTYTVSAAVCIAYVHAKKYV